MPRLQLATFAKRLLARSLELLEVRLLLHSLSLLLAQPRALRWRESAAVLEREVLCRAMPRKLRAILGVLWCVRDTRWTAYDIVAVADAVTVDFWQRRRHSWRL